MDHDGGGDHARRHRPPRPAPESDQDAGRNAGRGPEHGHAFRLQNEADSEPPSEEISHADYHGEPGADQPPPHESVGGGAAALTMCDCTLGHTRIPQHHGQLILFRSGSAIAAAWGRAHCMIVVRQWMRCSSAE